MDGARATATGTGGTPATDGGSRPGAHGVVAPLARRLEREHRDAAPHRDPAYIEGKLAAVRAYTRIFSPEVRGIGNLPADGAALLVGNHNALFYMPDAWVTALAIIDRRGTDHPAYTLAYDLLFAVPVAIISTRRRCPELPGLRFADLMAPVLMACWGMGRLLGPQLMVAGGGHRTNQWFGMYYAGQVGKRLPVPIFQSIEDFAIFAILLLVERWLRSIDPASGEVADGTQGAPRVLPPSGIVIGVGMVLWGIERFLDEHLWLGEDGHLGSILVQIAGVALAVFGIALLISRIKPLQRWRNGEGGDPAPSVSIQAVDTLPSDEGDPAHEPVSPPAVPSAAGPAPDND